MLELDRNYLGFRLKTVYFADRPHDIDNVDWLTFKHIRSKVDAPGFERQERLNAILDLTKGPELLMKSMASKCRSDIRRSEGDDIKVRINEGFEEFIRLNSEFREAKKLPHNFDFYLKPPLPGFCALFTAEHQGEIIGGILFVHDEKEMQGMLAASKRLAVAKEETALIARANRRLWWEAAGWGMTRGLEIMDMGNMPEKGTDPEQDGVSEFKRRFGAEPTYCYVYKKYYTHRVRFAIGCSAVIRRVKQGVLH